MHLVSRDVEQPISIIVIVFITAFRIIGHLSYLLLIQESWKKKKITFKRKNADK